VTDIKKHIILVVLTLMSVFMFAQHEQIDKLGAGRLKKLGKKALKYSDIYSAIDYLAKYCELKEGNQKIEEKLAESYKLSRDYENALIWYSKIYKYDTEKNLIALFNKGLMMKQLALYDSAIIAFETVKKKYTAKDKKTIISLCENEIKGAKLADSLMYFPLNIIITHLDSTVNKANIDFSPAYINDSTIIYSSLRSDSLKYYDILDVPKKIDYRKFYSAKLQNENWVGNNIPYELYNIDGSHNCNGAFSSDGYRFYFTRCETDAKSKVTCDIYACYKSQGVWSEPVKLAKPINDSKHNSTQPAIGYDNEKKSDILYFVSDRPGGKGGLDLWYAAYDSKNKTFKDPKNLGKSINTVGDEITPFYDNKAHNLYFSSNGLPGFGGFDVFKVTGEGKDWDEPINVKYPLNSSADEMYMVISPNNQEKGLLVSNREGAIPLRHPTCCDDIWAFELTDYFNYVTLSGKVFKIEYIENILDLTSKDQLDLSKIDEKDRFLLDSALVSLFMMYGDPPKAMFLGEYLTKEDGQYYFQLEKDKNYKLQIAKQGYFNRTFYFTTKELDAIKVKDTIKQNIGLSVLSKDPIVIKNIYYPFDESYLTPEAKLTIDTTLLLLMTENPHIIIEISSHTDSKGSDVYNIKLSDRRAKSVVDYLIQKGIGKERLQSKGYGETTPIAPNENPDGSDNPDGRQMNRRTEFRIIGVLNQYSDIIYKR